MIGHVGEFFFKADVRIGPDIVATHHTQAGWVALLSGLEKKCLQLSIQVECVSGYPITPITATSIDNMINTSVIQIYQEGHIVAFERFVMKSPTIESLIGMYTASASANSLEEGLQKLTTAKLSILTRESGDSKFLFLR